MSAGLLRMITLAVVAIVAPVVSAQDAAFCREVSTGRFECTFEGATSVIQRTDSEQLERGIDGVKWEFRLRVDWTGPCTYRLTSVPLENADDKPPESPNGPIDCRIIKVDELGYSVVVTWDGGPAEGLQMDYKRLR